MYIDIVFQLIYILQDCCLLQSLGTNMYLCSQTTTQNLWTFTHWKRKEHLVLPIVYRPLFAGTVNIVSGNYIM